MVKLKTEEYFSLHGILTETLSVNRVNLTIGIVLEDQIDDLISQLELTDVRRKLADIIQNAVAHYLKEKTQEVLALISKYSGDKKLWAMAHLKEECFAVAAGLVGRKFDDLEEEVDNRLRSKLKDDTYHLNDARQWLKNRGVLIDDLESVDQSEEE